MKQHVNLILVLMGLCIGGIVGLQLFWNYQNYKTTVRTFQNDINTSLTTAVDLEMDQRRRLLIRQAKIWLADTSFIRITCDTKNRDSNTVFHIQDRYPKAGDKSMFTFGMADFKPKINQVDPSTKTLVINRFADRRLWHDLKDGMIYYYTQRLGDSLRVAYDNSRVRLPALAGLYRQQLRARNIQSSFHISLGKTANAAYSTLPVNTSFGRPYKKEVVQAGFESPNSYFVKTMRWVILSTFLLVAISLFCFGYTARTLLSQHKLAQLKDDFINNMTHEFNTPLASIKITAEALKSFDNSPETQKKYLDIITYQTDKLTDLTTQLLTTNRQVASPKDDWRMIDLNQLIEQMIQDTKLRYQNQQLAITYRPGVESLFVRGRVDSLLNVLTNLLDNAVKYGPSNPEIIITVTQQNRWVEIGVADNGIGIPTEYRAQVFDPFFRIPQGNVHDIKGYGLGLSYARQVVQQHRGSIRVEANQPCGSLFYVRLPLAL